MSFGLRKPPVLSDSPCLEQSRISLTMRGKTTGQGLGCLAIIGPGRLINQSWRAFTGTLCWITFGLGCALLAVFIALLRLLVPQPGRAVILRRWAHYLARAWMGWCRLLGSIHVQHNFQPHPSPGLVVANHPTLLDVIWILSHYPNLCCVTKADIDANPLFRFLARHLDYVSNKDPERLLQMGSTRLQQGETMLVFPEATRTPVNQLPKFHLAAAELAVRSGAAIHPVIVHKSGPYLSKGYPWYTFPSDTMRVYLEFGAVFSPQLDDSPRVARRRLNGQLEGYFHQALIARNRH